MFSPSRLRLLLRACAVGVLFLAAAGSLPAAKVRLANDQPAARALAFPGQDYGGFRVVEVDDATASALAASGLGEKLADADVIHLNAGALDTTKPAARALRVATAGFTGKRLHLVQFAGPIKQEWVDSLEKDGLRVVTYIPNNAYLVWGESSGVARFQVRAADVAASAVQWEAPWRDEWKLAPSVRADPQTGRAAAEWLAVQLVEDKESNAATLAILRAAGGYFLKDPEKAGGYVNFVLRLPASAQTILTARPDVVSIHRYEEPRKMDESQAMVLAGNLNGNVPNPGNYFSILAGWGFTQAQFDASNFIVDVSDTGIDNGTATPNHFVLYRNGDKAQTSRLAYRSSQGTAGSDAGQGNGGHGQLNASIIGGFVPNTSVTVNGNTTSTTTFPHADSQGFRYGLGVAPFSKLGSSIIFDPDFTFPDFPTLQAVAYASGARISSNSWGSPVAGAYTADSQTFDRLVRNVPGGTAGNQSMVLVFSAGNRGPGATTLGAPGTGKNVITVGAAEGVRSHALAVGGLDAAGTDGSGLNDASANSANDLLGVSSRGPCTDGRIKPDLVAGGTHVTGMTFVTASSTLNGTAAATFRAEGISGLTGNTAATGQAADFFPTVNSGGTPPYNQAQQWWTTSSGTSHSTAAVSGAAALVYQQFLNNPAYLGANRTPSGSAPPSPALVKAYLMNSARYLTGANANDQLPSNAQGMGHANLGTAFDGVSRAIRDQHANDRFTGTGQARTFAGTITDSTKPFRVTLAWTDKEGPTAGNAYVNDLNLIVTVGGQTYRGNVFNATGGLSATGGAADARNNVESVFLPVGTAGNFTVTVSAANIAGQADPTVAGNNQDYALVVYNSGALSTVLTPPLLSVGAVSFGTGNMLVPNGCNTLTIPLFNGGEISAAAVSATLAASTTGVTVTRASSAYPDVAPMATAGNATSFQVFAAASVPCGTQAAFTLTVSYSGGGSPTVIPLTLQVGASNTDYAFTASTGATIPVGGVLVASSNTDDAVVSVTGPPFAFSIYGTNFAAGATLRASTNGNLQLVSTGGASSEVNAALPSATFSATAPTLMPYWDDLILTTTNGGIYVNTVGTAPNRQWVVEWRGRAYLAGSSSIAQTINFAIVLTEGFNGFEYRYAQVADATGANGSSATVGVQAGGAAGSRFTQYSLNAANVTAGLVLTAAFPACVSGSGPCDTTAPTLSPVAIASSNDFASRAKAGDVITLTFTASEPIQPPSVTIAGRAASVSAAGGNSWTATLNVLASDPQGTAAFSVAFRDLAGNSGATVTATTNNSAIVIDNTAPTILAASVASNNATPSRAKAGDVVTLTFTTSELTFIPGVTIAGRNVISSPSGGNVWTASTTVAAGDPQGAVAFAITPRDLASNIGVTVTTTSNGSGVAIDTAAPTLSAVALASNNAVPSRARAGDTLTLAFTASEPIQAPAVTIAGRAAAVASAGGNSWTATLAVDSADPMGAATFAIGFRDLAGNTGPTATSTTNGSGVTLDTSAPTLPSVSISSSNAVPSTAGVGDTITLAFSSAEPIQTPAVTIAGRAAIVASPGANAWTASVRVTSADAPGGVPFLITFRDLAGNNGGNVTATTNGSAVTIDTPVGAAAIVAQPVSQTAPAAVATDATTTVTFNVTVSGPGPFTYQWLFNDAPIPEAPAARPAASGAGSATVISGTTKPTLTITNPTAANVGKYTVRVTSQPGVSIVSTEARLELGTLAPRLINLSTRLRVETGENILIGGFVIQGSATKRTLVRALGPSLAAAGVAGVLADPALEIRDAAGALVAANDNWRSNNAAAVQDTGLAPSSDAESALVLDLPAGAYTALVRGVGNATGVALVEVYDLQPSATGIRPINLSTRGRVQTGDNVMIGGFVVNGTASRRVVIRAIGPALAGAGVQGALANPTLQIFNGQGQPIAANDDWQTQTTAGSSAADLMALGLQPPDPREAAIVLALPPGAYTAIVRGAGDTSGVAIVEVYEVP